ncbi:MAG: gliding motility-associated C-terminal domain-containing protein, partial [Cyclobacteriaceae bacterium]
APSDPKDALQFGAAVKMSADYIIIGAAGYGGKVYLYRKPPGGWVSQAEFASFKVANSGMFGVGYENPIAISDDQQTIAITDQNYQATLERDYVGAVFVYHKEPHQEWSGSVTPVMINAPELEASDFGRAGVAIQGDRLVTGTPFAPTGNGRLYVYRDPSGEFLDLLPEAKLSSGDPAVSAGLGLTNFVFTADGIFTMIGVDLDTDPKTVVAFFEMPSSGSWSDTDYTCAISPHGPSVEAQGFAKITTNGQDIFMASTAKDGKGYLTKIKKGAVGWSDAEHETVDVFTPETGQFVNNYGAVSTANQNSFVAVGFLPHPQSVQGNLSLKILSANPDNTWDSQLIYPTEKSTAGHYYGRDILGFEDYLFVGAPYDGTVKSSGGAVYAYKKSGTSWQKTGTILPILKGRYDDVFGTALATNGTHLAIGAAGFEEHGRVFIYKKKYSDWSDTELVQEIELPEDILTIFAYGDNLAMSKDWLLIPYVQNNPGRIMLAIYEFDGTQWEYAQVLEIGGANIFAKFTTPSVDIEDETILVGNTIIERNIDTGLWQKRYVLSPSDPENMQISSDFTHWISNGSMFGHEVDISNNTIFISAPLKDYGSVWDVGAIYVYTKKPWESWSSRIETAKLLPRVKDELELFGYSMKALGNTLIAGAPGADFNKDGATARNKPGRAYVFQSKDYFWQDVVPLIDFTGDSFVKDYFGLAVNLDESDFFIASPIEDIDNAKLSGSVYVTPTPPIIMLVPPVCSNLETIDLFGYPFGGTWSGPGIVNAAEGIFDPLTAGIGEHEFTYVTPSCTYEGKLKIRVEAPVQATLNVAQEHLVCESSASIQIPLSINSVADHNYLWYYRQNADEPFFPLNQKQPAMNATSRGEYMAKVSNTVCESFSPIVTIKNEIVELTLQSLDKICEDKSAGLDLSAIPSGGTWSGPGVSGKKFNTAGLPDGTYTLTYRFKSVNNCTYEETTPAVIERMLVPAIKRSAGNLCAEGFVNIDAISAFGDDIQYTWERKSDGEADFYSLDENGASLKISDRGLFQLKADNGECVTRSNTISVDDKTFGIAMTPEASELKSCNGNPTTLSLIHAGGQTYQWFYKNTSDGDPVPVAGNLTNVLKAEESGYYYAEISSGICLMESPQKQVTIVPADSIFIPNVFTPNGDGFNDVFLIESNQSIVPFRITNRHGKEIYFGNSATGWSGEGVASGVYFWYVFYLSCEEENKTLKGTVHLMR